MMRLLSPYMYGSLKHCKIQPSIWKSMPQLRRHSSHDSHQDAHRRVITSLLENSLLHDQLYNNHVVDILQKNYPNHILTVTLPSIGLLDLAKTDSLIAKLETSHPHYLTHAKNVGVDFVANAQYLRDIIQLERYNCRWKGHNFYMYEADVAGKEDNTVSRQYILYPREHAQMFNGRSIATDELLVAALVHGNEVKEVIWLYDDGHWQRSKRLWENIEDASWDDVILGEGLSRELRTDVESFFDRKGLYGSFGIPWRRGIILHGLPGNGKTISIKAIMRSLSLRPTPIPTLYVKSLGHGCTHESIRSIFEKARETAPCLLVFEDLDSLVTDNVRSFFLNEVDGLEQNDGILMLGSTNYLDNLDVGISKRPSRFDRKFHFPLPAMAERVKYCEFWRSKLQKNSLVEFPSQLSEQIAMASEGLSFAYLQEIFVASMFDVMEGLGTSPSEDSNIIWRTVEAQVAKVRQELKDGEKSVEDAGRNSVLIDALSGSVRPTGFAR